MPASPKKKKPSTSNRIASATTSSKVIALRRSVGVTAAFHDRIATAQRAAARTGKVKPLIDLSKKLADSLDNELTDIIHSRALSLTRAWNQAIGRKVFSMPGDEDVSTVLGDLSARDILAPAERSARAALAAGMRNAKTPAERREVAEQALRVMRNASATLARTALNRAHNAAAIAVINTSTEVDRVAAIAVLDDVTTDTCIALNGGVWDVATGKPTEESDVQRDFPGPPPWHYNCRTTLMPILRGDAPPSIRNVDDWLEEDEDAAIAALGEERINLWKEGKLPTTQLIDQRNQPTIDDAIEESEADDLLFAPKSLPSDISLSELIKRRDRAKKVIIWATKVGKTDIANASIKRLAMLEKAIEERQKKNADAQAKETAKALTKDAEPDYASEPLLTSAFKGLNADEAKELVKKLATARAGYAVESPMYKAFTARILLVEEYIATLVKELPSLSELSFDELITLSKQPGLTKNQTTAILIEIAARQENPKPLPILATQTLDTLEALLKERKLLKQTELIKLQIASIEQEIALRKGQASKQNSYPKLAPDQWSELKTLLNSTISNKSFIELHKLRNALAKFLPLIDPNKPTYAKIIARLTEIDKVAFDPAVPVTAVLPKKAAMDKLKNAKTISEIEAVRADIISSETDKVRLSAMLEVVDEALVEARKSEERLEKLQGFFDRNIKELSPTELRQMRKDLLATGGPAFNDPSYKKYAQLLADISTELGDALPEYDKLSPRNAQPLTLGAKTLEELVAMRDALFAKILHGDNKRYAVMLSHYAQIREAIDARSNKHFQQDPLQLTKDVGLAQRIFAEAEDIVEKSSPKMKRGESSAVRAYTGIEYRDINNYLRNQLRSGPALSPGEAKKKDYHSSNPARRVAEIDKAMEANKLGEQTILWRGSSPRDYGLESFSEVKVGQTIVDNGYISTSRNIMTAISFANVASKDKDDPTVSRKAVLRIHAGPNQSAIDTTYGRASSHESEREILLARGTPFKITAINVVDGVRYIDVLAGDARETTIDDLHTSVRSHVGDADALKSMTAFALSHRKSIGAEESDIIKISDEATKRQLDVKHLVFESMRVQPGKSLMHDVVTTRDTKVANSVAVQNEHAYKLAADKVLGMMHKSVMDKEALTEDGRFKAPKFRASRDNERSYYDPEKHEVVISTKSEVYVSEHDLVHEFAHALETKSTMLREEARAFLAARAKADPHGAPRPLKDVRVGYGKDEMAWFDSFVDPYMGKVNPNGDTELIAMGVSLLVQNPLELYRSDREMFEWLQKILHGQRVLTK